MEKLIEQKLKDIEVQTNVKIIYAVEAGSRMWGFASPNSDYDVRFVYVRPMEDYLRLDAIRDVIEWQLDDMLDISGWDLQKALRLLNNSNMTLHEWSRSPIVYRTSEEWDVVSAVISRYFTQKAGAHYYLNKAKKDVRENLRGKTVRLKKYLYALQHILSCKWILEHNSFPPIFLSELTDVLDDDVKPYILDLLNKKRECPELGSGPRIDGLNDFLNNSIIQYRKQIQRLKPNETTPWEELNAVFLQILKMRS